MKRHSPITIIVIILALSLMLACSVPGMATPTPKIRYITWTPEPTATEIPTETPTLAPSDTPAPGATATLPPTDTIPAPPTVAPTLSADTAIKVFYISKDNPGQFGCNESLYYLLTTQPKTTNVANDIRYAVNTIVTYKQPQIGSLYHGGYASTLAVANVELGSDGSVVVSLSGQWVATEDRCDGKRLIDQLRQTIKQFPGIGYIQILINGFPIADVVSRK